MLSQAPELRTRQHAVRLGRVLLQQFRELTSTSAQVIPRRGRIVLLGGPASLLRLRFGQSRRRCRDGDLGCIQLPELPAHAGLVDLPGAGAEQLRQSERRH